MATHLLVGLLAFAMLPGCASYIGRKIVTPPAESGLAIGALDAESESRWREYLEPRLFARRWSVESPVDGAVIAAGLIPAGSYPHRFELREERDNLQLDASLQGGLLVQVNGPARGTVMLLHGWLADHRSLLFHALRLANRGWDVILADLRGHGRSQGQWVTFGHHETGDLNALIDTVAREGEMCRPLYLMGHSLGGAVALLAAAENPTVDGVVSISAYADAAEVIPLVLGELAPWWLRPWTGARRIDQSVAHAERLAGIRFTDLAPERVAPGLDRPVLLYHGADDSVVPPAHAVRLAAALPGATLITVPARDHTSILAERDRLVDGFNAWARDLAHGTTGAAHCRG